MKHLVPVSHEREQRHAGMELQVVWKGEHPIDAPPGRKEGPGDLLKPSAKNRVLDIRSCFLEATNSKPVRRFGPTQAGKLWKDKPHPVPDLYTRTDLFQCRLVDVSLGFHKAFETAQPNTLWNGAKFPSGLWGRKALWSSRIAKTTKVNTPTNSGSSKTWRNSRAV